MELLGRRKRGGIMVIMEQDKEISGATVKEMEQEKMR